MEIAPDTKTVDLEKVNEVTEQPKNSTDVVTTTVSEDAVQVRESREYGWIIKHLLPSRKITTLLLITTLFWTHGTSQPLRICLSLLVSINISQVFFGIGPKRISWYWFEIFRIPIYMLCQVYYFKETDTTTKLVTIFIISIHFHLPLLVFLLLILALVCHHFCCNNAQGPIPNAQSVLKRLKSHVMPTDSVEVCSICTEEYKQGEHIRTLPCKHEFHKACVDQWLSTAGQTCPLCRNNVVNAVNSSSS